MKFNALSRIFEVNDTDWSSFDDSGHVVNSYKETDIPEISISQIEEYISLALDESPPVSVLLYGDPGIGKSQVVIQYAITKGNSLGRQPVSWVKLSTKQKELLIADPTKYYTLIDVRAAQVEPSDFTGIPKMGTSTPYIQMSPHKWVHYMSTPGSAGVLFLDELNQADPGVLKAAFQVVLDRAAGETAFTDDWGIVAAGNLGTEFNEPIPPALTNRFEVYYVKADVKSWLTYAKEKKVDVSVTDFVESDPQNNFYSLPTIGSSNPYPTPRQLFTLSGQIKATTKKYQTALASGTPPKLSIFEIIGNKAAALCGSAWAYRFITFIRHTAKFNWATITTDPKAHFDKKQVDKMTALILFTRQTATKTLGKNSEHSDEQKIQFCGELISVFGALDIEWKTILLNYLSVDSKILLIEFISIVVENKKSIPGAENFIAKDIPLIKSVVGGKV